MALDLKRRINSVIRKPSLWLDKIELETVKKDIVEWIIEVLIEGFIANFATHYLLGFEFSVMTMIAYGFVIKQFISIYWRLRKDGSGIKLPKKDE